MNGSIPFPPQRNPGALYFLPNEDEWYKAAYYVPSAGVYLDWPNVSLCTLPGPTASGANCGSVVGGVTDVGSYGGSMGPNGTFDQGGNVSEWTETVEQQIGGNAIIRGGTVGKTSGHFGSRYWALWQLAPGSGPTATNGWGKKRSAALSSGPLPMADRTRTVTEAWRYDAPGSGASDSGVG